MQTREIPPDEWSDFCRGFTMQHQSWISTLSQCDTATDISPERPPDPRSVVLSDAPFRALALEDRGREHPPRLDVLVGDEPITVTAPSRIAFVETDSGEHHSVRIDAADGTRLELRFRVAAKPESVDGV